MAKKKPEVNPFIVKGFKNTSPPPGEFPVKDPAVLKGIRDSIKGAQKAGEDRARFKAWGKGVDYDAIKMHQENMDEPKGN